LTETRRAVRGRGLRPAFEVVSEFLRQRDFSLEPDAKQVVARAGTWAPHRVSDKELFTTSLLLFALVESKRPSYGDRELRAVIEPFFGGGNTRTRRKRISPRT
jgi:hypothetical protein